MSAYCDFHLQFGTEGTSAVVPRDSASSKESWRIGGAQLDICFPGANSGNLFRHWNSGTEQQWWLVGDSYRHGSTADPDAILEKFGREAVEGRERAEELCGSCVVIGWDGTSKTWRVWTNLAGSQHVYHCEDSGSPAIGTYSPALYASSNKVLDWEGLSGFFALGFFPGDRTHYKDVHILRPASRYEFAGDGRLLGADRYWQWSFEPDEKRSELRTIEEFGEILRMVIADQTRSGRVALPLSGGLDSRTVAACLPAGASVPAFGYGYSNRSIEIELAAEVAHARGLPFHGHVIRPYLLGRIHEVALATECFQDITQCRQADVSEWLGDQADWVLAAHWGDVFCDAMGLEGESEADGTILEAGLKKFLKRGRRWLADEVCRPHMEGCPEDAVRESLAEEVRRIPRFGDADFRLKVLKTEQWAFRWTLASLRMYQAAAFPRIPFLDPRVIRFFCTVPTRYLRGRRLQIEFLKRHASDLARIRWQPYHADLYSYHRFGTWHLPQRAWRKFRRVASGEKPIQRNWEVQFLASGQMPKLEEALLRESPGLKELVSPAKVRALLDDFRANPDGANGYTVSALLTFATWLEHLSGRAN